MFPKIDTAMFLTMLVSLLAPKARCCFCAAASTTARAMGRLSASQVGEVVVDAVALGDVVDSDHIVVAGGSNHDGDRAAGDAKRSAHHFSPFGRHGGDQRSRQPNDILRVPGQMGIRHPWADQHSGQRAAKDA
ncbi:MAG: hypothetical protein Q8K93_14335 [Reyranella sp.]|uniref:hypothetical protein n=1 Tax=Reyranella sp. TaxID=1929291 RepID=UPI0027307118|nr:hypothetical protein [Reyranella sp.]MDP1963370.1 hypothetical protein [Reyranella sp.]MDP2376109.1 hypothetical protein [Reyranella sp.]